MSPASVATARKIVQILRALDRRTDPSRRNWSDLRKAKQKALKPFKSRSKEYHLSGPRSAADHQMPHRTTKDPS
jgi:hypothetical protein